MKVNKVNDVYSIGSYVLDLNKNSMHCNDSRHYIEFSESERKTLNYLIKNGDAFNEAL